MVFEHL